MIEPAIVGELECAAATYRTPRGVVSSAWRRSKRGVVTLDVTIPAGATAQVRLPIDPDGEVVTEGGRPAAQAAGVGSVRVEGETAVIEVTSGSYAFRVAPAVAEQPSGPQPPAPQPRDPQPQPRAPAARAAAPKLQLLSARAKKGRLTLGLRLDVTATVRVKVVERRAGTRVGGRCVATAPKRAKGARCVRLVTLGTVVKRNVRAGLPTVTLPAKVGRSALRGRTVQLTVWAERDGRRSALAARSRGRCRAGKPNDQKPVLRARGRVARAP